MSDVTIRHLKTLELVPPYPRKTTAKEIQDQLEDLGLGTSERTVQRDLEAFSQYYPLTCDKRSKPYGWSWMQGVRAITLPAMDPATALTFRFVREYVEPLLPQSVRDGLTPHFKAAEQTLDNFSQANLPGWAEKVVVIPQGQPLQTPPVDGAILATVFDALLENRVLSLAYRARVRDGELREHAVVHPLGVVLRSGIYYLVAIVGEHEKAIQLAMHRIERAEKTRDASRRPQDFSLRRYVEQGNFAYPVGDRIELRARFARATAFHLIESPLSPDQRIEDVDDDTVRVTATVQDTQQLRWWLHAFADHVIVEAPAELRDAFAEAARRLADRYAS